MEDIFRFFGVMATLVSVGLIGYGGIVAINAFQQRLARRGTPPGLGPDEIELFRAQVEETERLRERVAELEERVDFAERLIGRGAAEPDRAGGALGDR